MIDLDEQLRADAERWNAGLPKPADLDAAVAAMDRPTPRRRWLLPALTAAVVAALAVGLAVVAQTRSHDAAPPAADLAQITGVVWTYPDSYDTVIYTDTTMQMSDGCTLELFHLIVADDTLTRGTPAGAASTCGGGPLLPKTDPTVRASAHFAAVVVGPVTWAREGNVLTLTKGGVGSVRLTTDGKSAPAAAGTTWVLSTYEIADGPTEDATRRAVLTIDADGNFAAEFSCGHLIGTALVNAASIDFTQTRYDGPVCSIHLTDEEEVIGRMLREQVHYYIRGSALVLQDGSGRLLHFEADEE